MRKVWAVYHLADFDGMACGAIIKKAFPAAKMVPFNHGRSLPRSIKDGDVVIMADIAVPLEDMIGLNERCEFILVDHHKTVIEECKGSNFNPDGLCQQGFGACELCWTYFFPNTSVPRGIRLLSRYDIWDLEWHEDVWPYQVGLSCFDTDPTTESGLATWKKILDDDQEFLNDVLVHGRAVKKYVDRQDRRFMKGSYAYESEFQGLNAIITNRQPAGSGLFKSVWDESKHDLMIAYARIRRSKGENQWKVSLYSDKPGVDVGKLAESFGGGGHANAAGFVCDALPFEH